MNLVPNSLKAPGTHHRDAPSPPTLFTSPRKNAYILDPEDGDESVMPVFLFVLFLNQETTKGHIGKLQL